MIQKVKIEEFISLSAQYPVLDVRSPGEYEHAHVPGAYNLPLFSNEERKVVGTAYKQQGRELAIKIGLNYFGVKMTKMVEDAEEIINVHQSNTTNSKFHPDSYRDQIPTILVHCWRGGMRSAGVAWLLDLYGFKVYTLTGGYKAFRNWALQQFERPYPFLVVGGYTGSGKTEALKELADTKHAVIDLEGIARHKGSAFGGFGKPAQPTQEMFENLLATALHTLAAALPENEPIWIEDESQRIGAVNLPNALYNAMQRSPLLFVNVPFEDRLNFIVAEYGVFATEELINAVKRIQKRLGGLNAKNVINYLLEDNCKEAFRILLSYYDKYYERGMATQEKTGKLPIVIECGRVDAKMTGEKLAGKKIFSDGVTNTRN